LSAVIAARVASVIAVIAVVTVVMPRQTLTFFIASLGPAVGLVVTELVAVEAFYVALVMLLIICGKGLFRAVLLALSNNMAFVLIRYESDNLVRGDSVASAVSCCIDTANSGLIRGGERTKQDGHKFVVVQVLPHRGELLLQVDKPSKVSAGIVLVTQSSALKLLAKIHSNHLGPGLIDGFHSVPYFHSGSFALDMIEHMVRYQSSDHVHCCCFFGIPMLLRGLPIDVASCNVSLR
jgi:hypothetical protein